MAVNIRDVHDIYHLIEYFSENLSWNIDMENFDDIEDLTYDFDAKDLGLKEEAFAKIVSLRQLQSMVAEQEWGIFCVEFDSNKFEVSALRKILSSLVPRRRASADHKVWDKHDLLFLCNWGKDNNRTIGIAHFEDKETGLPQIKMISCAPALEDQTQINVFEERLQNLRWPKRGSSIQEWREAWSSAFTTAYHETIDSSHKLTIQLAAEAQGIRNRILETLSIEAENGYVHQLYEKFRETLVHDLKEEEFADMYAQTIVYGLFSARCMDQTQDDFSVDEAIQCIPNTNPFLKTLMAECVGVEKNKALSFDELEIDNVVDLLRHTQTTEIIKDFNRQTGGGKEDPVIHFYEEFLTAYNKAQKVQRGVYYTPQPVVNFIVRAVDDILKNEFGYKDGLATTETKKIKTFRKSERKVNGVYKDIEVEEKVPAVQVLDPATGTGTFLRQVILQIYDNFRAQHKGESEEKIKEAWNQYVPEHLLPRINGFELMMAPYAVAHMKLAMVLKDTGYDFENTPRLNVYLTNSLEQAGSSDNQLTLFDDPLAFESAEANGIKKNSGINILIGNPPYAGESSNKGPWITELMEDYKKEPGGIGKLQEKNPKWLNDDYVKFIRYAQNVVSDTEEAVVAYINPHGFVGNPTFRGMRWKLMQTFDAIYIIDLHGNSNRKETCPNGSKDENVFDIQQGVCICIFVKIKGSRIKKCKVFHTDIYGTRQYKYEILSQESIYEFKFTEVLPVAPECLYRKVNKNLKAEYDSGFSVQALFSLGAVGLITARDSLNLGFNRQELILRLDLFRTMREEDARIKYALGKDVRDWKISWAQKDINENAIKSEKIDDSKVIPIMYRPFDTRYMLYTGMSRGLVCYPRSEVTDHFVAGKNLGLATGRTNKSTSCDHFIAVDRMIEVKCAERTTGSVIYPLYCYYRSSDKLCKNVNMNADIIHEFEQAVGLKYIESWKHVDEKCEFDELQLFYYIYAVLYNDSYRKKYAEFLKSDYPKIPYIKNPKLFYALANVGKKLVFLHTMNSEIDTSICTFIDFGRAVEKVSFKDGKLFINKKSYFEGVNAADWEFIIGGYQPLQRWYKDRKGRVLTCEELEEYKKIVLTVRKTILLMSEISELIQY